EELIVLLLEPHALDRLGGTEALVELAVVDQILQFDLREGAALAELHMLNLHRRPKASLMLDDVAGANFVTVDLGHGPYLGLGLSRLAAGPAVCADLLMGQARSGRGRSDSIWRP